MPAEKDGHLDSKELIFPYLLTKNHLRGKF